MGRSAYNALSATDRLDVLAAAEARTGRLPHVLEKDFWVVQTMEVLFGSPFGGDLVLKGGTSLSKAYDFIRRFSEDVDVTYDIRAFAPELVSHPDTDITGYDPLPPTRSQVKRWTRIINDRLTTWVDGTASRAVEDGFQAIGTEASVSADGHHLFIAYACC